MSTDREPLVVMSDITKRFGRVTVLQDVQFSVLAGEAHVLAGENGAGKSTLIKILGGVHADFEGRIEIAGRRARPRTPLEATALGVAVIHQELSLIGSMSVADNLFLGRMPACAGFGPRRPATTGGAALAEASRPRSRPVPARGGIPHRGPAVD